MEYLIIIIFTFLCAIFDRRMAKDIKIFSICLILIYVILLMGFRYRVGIDTMNYMSGYKHMPTFENLIHFDFNSTRIEPGYIFIAALCKSFTNEFWLMQLVMAAITDTCIFIFIYRYCKNPFIGILLFFLLAFLYFNTEIMRESAAIGIFLLNFRNLERGNLTRYYLLSPLSIIFHYSAFIILLFPLVKHLKLNWIYIVLCIGILSITPIIESINELLVNTTIYRRVNLYVSQVQLLNLHWRLGELIRSALPPILAIYLYRRYHLYSDKYKMVLLQILFCIGTFAIPVIFQRFTNYTTLFSVVLLSNFLYLRRIHILKKVLVTLFLIGTQCFYYYTMYQRWIPYVSIFDPIKVEQRELLWWVFNH